MIVQQFDENGWPIDPNQNRIEALEAALEQLALDQLEGDTTHE